jgi:hypothetical protein
MFEALINRLKEATEPERELDCEIAVAVLGGEVKWQASQYTGNLIPVRHYPSANHLSGIGHAPVMNYTASIDSALSLVPEGYQWLVSNRAPTPLQGRAYLHNGQMVNIGGGLERNPNYRGAEYTAATPAIALCMTALKAREE